MTPGLEGRVAIVTGCGRERGIGRATALELGRRGAKVVVTAGGRPRPELDMGGGETVGMDTSIIERTASEIASRGGSAIWQAVDVRVDEEIRACVDRTVEVFGGVDLLVNNAGTWIGSGAALAASDAAWQQSWDINVMGAVRFCRAVEPHMREAGAGSIVNVSSVSGIRMTPHFGAYNVTKAALVALTKTLAMDLGSHGIRSNAVCPGDTDTQMGDLVNESFLERGATPEDIDQGMGVVALGRRGRPEEIASVIAWVAGATSSYMNGAVVPVDGGYFEGL